MKCQFKVVSSFCQYRCTHWHLISKTRIKNNFYGIYMKLSVRDWLLVNSSVCNNDTDIEALAPAFVFQHCLVLYKMRKCWCIKCEKLKVQKRVRNYYKVRKSESGVASSNQLPSHGVRSFICRGPIWILNSVLLLAANYRQEVETCLPLSIQFEVNMIYRTVHGVSPVLLVMFDNKPLQLLTRVSVAVCDFWVCLTALIPWVLVQDRLLQLFHLQCSPNDHSARTRYHRAVRQYHLFQFLITAAVPA